MTFKWLPLLFLFLSACSQLALYPSRNIASALSSDCSHHFQKLTATPEFLRKERKELISDYLENLRLKGSRLRLKLEKQQVIEYPYIIIGGGVHGGIVSRVLSQNAPDMKGLVLEESSSVSSTFSQIGRSTYLTSPDEFNKVPGTPLSVADFNYKKGEIATTEELGASALLNHYIANNDFLFDEKVLKIEVKDKITLIKTKNYVFQTEHLIIAPGIGTPRDGQSHPKIKNLMEFLTASHQSSENVKDPRTSYQGKRVAVIGGGGGAQSGVALLAASGPRALYQHDIKSPDVIHWFGTKYEDAAHFRRENTIPGHASMENKIENGEIKLNQGFVSQIEPKVKDGKEYFEIEYKHNGTVHKEEVDEVIMATGYDNRVQDFFDEEMPFAPLQGKTKEIGRKLPGRSIYLAGPGAGMKVTDEELKKTYAKLPQSVEVTGQRTYELAQFVSKELQAFHGKKTRLTEDILKVELPIVVMPSRFKAELTKKHFIQVELIKALNGNFLPEGTTLKFKKISETELEIQITGLSLKTGNDVVQKIKRSKDLLNQIHHQEELTFKVGHNSDGVLSSDNVKMVFESP